MATSTREQFLETAEKLFAERGFYGASIAAIAEQLGLTKQALLHHFGTKEKLYGAVLERISADFERQLSALEVEDMDPCQRLKTHMLRLFDEADVRAQRTQLLMRELLDNRHRAEAAEVWYLKGYLEKLIVFLKAVEGWEKASDAEALALIYQLLGAINYYSISGPTLRGIFGNEMAGDMDKKFGQGLNQLIDKLTARM